MRTSKIMSFSVPPEFEDQIKEAAQSEHRTISEFLREAVRQYVKMKQIEKTRSVVASRLRKAGINESDIEAAIDEERK